MLILVVCFAHASVTVYFQVIDCGACMPLLNDTLFNGTINTAAMEKNGTVLVEESLPRRGFKALIYLSGFNTFLISIFLGAPFTWILLWRLAVVKEWQYFNSNETEM